MPGAIRITVCVVSRRIAWSRAASSGWSAASKLNAEPAANGPVWRVCVTIAGPGLKSMRDGAYRSPDGRLVHAPSASAPPIDASASAWAARDSGLGSTAGFMSRPPVFVSAAPAAAARRHGEREPSAAGGECGPCPARVFPGGAGARAVMASAFRRVAATFD
ncbi:hypothetical protein Y046_5929 [Burkholderia pseudomallei MSHR2990]|nr:hypothetical protein Y046_5929 [Burkholderia pseudomallei MSHR2990]